MKLARPPGGFKVVLTPTISALIDGQCAKDPTFAKYWDDITERLRFVAHVEGVEDARLGKGCRIWASAGDEERNLPRVTLVYLVLGDTVRIRLASIA